MRQLIFPLLLLLFAVPALAQEKPVELPATTVVGKRDPGVKATTASVGTLGEAPLLDTPAAVMLTTFTKWRRPEPAKRPAPSRRPRCPTEPAPSPSRKW